MKSAWLVSIILVVVLFLFAVYPGVEALGNVPGPFQIVFRVLFFIAFFSLLIFLLTEMHIWRQRFIEISSSDAEPRKDNITNASPGTRYNVDTKKHYQLLTRQLIDIIYASLTAQTVVIYLFNRRANTYIRQEHSSSQQSLPTDTFSADGEVFKDYHLHSKAVLYQSDQIGPDHLIYYQNQPKIGTLMLIPILVNKSFVGFIGLDSIDKQAWGAEDIELVNSFAELYANAILQIDIIDQQETYANFFRDLCRLNTKISLGIAPHELYKQAAAILKKYFTFDKLTFAFFNERDSQKLVIEYVEGSEADYTIGHEITAQNGVWDPIINGGKPVLINDYDKSEIEFRFQPDDLKIIPFRSAAGVPFITGSIISGGVLLESYRSNSYMKDDINTLKLFSKNFSAIFNRLMIYQSMKDLAMIDGLTNLYNHRAFKDLLQVEIERSRRYGGTITLLILDLDNFKRINDTYGHLHGDYVLKKSAKLIRSSVRTIDTVARYGGEEFAVILINVDNDDCIKTAERICINMRNFLFNKGKMTERITISIGISKYPGDGEDIQSLISSADMAMYKAKRAGGNQVVVFERES